MPTFIVLLAVGIAWYVAHSKFTQTGVWKYRRMRAAFSWAFAGAMLGSYVGIAGMRSAIAGTIPGAIFGYLIASNLMKKDVDPSKAANGGMDRLWWFSKNGEHIGPIPDAQMADLFEKGDIDSRTLVFTDGMPAWCSLGEAPHLLNSALRPPPPLQEVLSDSPPSAYSSLHALINDPPSGTAIDGSASMYSPMQVFVASFLGSPITAAWFLAQNHLALFRPEKERPTLIFGGIATLAVVIVAFLFPDKITLVVWSLAYSGGYYYYAQQRFGGIYETYTEDRRRKGSWWRIVGISLLFVAAISTLLGLAEYFFRSFSESG